jgi:hypothetical protein
MTLSLVLAMGATTAPPEGSPGALRIEIAVPACGQQQRSFWIDQPLMVVVTNISGEPVRVWGEQCSWGYRQLSFEITDGDKTWTLRRREHPWYRNVPYSWTLDPGEPLVLSATLTSSELWESSNGAPAAELKGKPVTIRAVFAADEDDFSRERSVWSGRVKSTPHVYGVQ